MHATVERFLDLEAQVDEKEEEEVQSEDEMSGFIIDQDPQGEDNDDPDEPTHHFMAHDNMEDTALLHRIAGGYDARAAAERVIGSSESVDGKFPVNSDLVKIAQRMDDADQAQALYSFKVPRHKTEYFLSCIRNLKTTKQFAGWDEEVFALNHLPGRIFVLAPSEHIDSLRKKSGILSQPVQIPRMEWGAGGHSSLFLPWVINPISAAAWVRISKHNQPYFGDLAYVVGSAVETDVMLIAVVPRIRRTPRLEEMMDVVSKEAGEIGKRRGKGRKQAGRGRGKGKASVLPPVLFDPETMLARFGTTVKVSTVEEKDPLKNFAEIFAERVVTRDPDTNKRVVSLVHHDLVGFGKFHWAVTPVTGENIYQFGGQVFYRGLLILPIYSYGVVERVTVPPVDQVIPFAESNIDPVHINRLLSQLHWRIGDRVARADGLYELQDIQMDIGLAACILIAKTNSATASMVQLFRPNELRRKFLAGDDVVVVAGVHKGLTGSVLNDDDSILRVLMDKGGTYISVPYQWAAGCLASAQVTPEVRADIQPGDFATVIDGPERHRTGLVVEKSERGTMLSVYELQTRRTFLVEAELVERQGQPFVTREVNPWEHEGGKVFPGDFILVMEGDLAGKEGFVKDVLDNSDLMVLETSKEPAQPPIILEGQQMDPRAHSDGEIETFLVPSLKTFCFHRVQLYDVIQVVNGLFKGTTGYVLDIRLSGYLTIKEIAKTRSFELSSESLGLNQFLNIYRSAVVIRDRLCVGDTVQLKYGSGEGRRGIVKHFLDGGIVMIEQEFGHVASSTVFQAHILSLEKINLTFKAAPKHRAIGKRVQVTNGNLKGLTGYVTSYNYIRNLAQVDLISVGKTNIPVSDVVYLESRLGIDEVPQVNVAPPNSPPRQATPIPDGPLVPHDAPDHETWNVSPSDLNLIADDWRMGSPEVPIPECFLTDPIWHSLDGKHVRVALGPSFGGGNRVGYTTIPLQFDNDRRPSKVSMYWTDNKGRWQQGQLSFQDLKPAHPTKSKVLVVVLSGDSKGQVFKVDKVTKADGTVLLATKSRPMKELAANVCVVEDHLDTDCTCRRM